MAPVWEYKEIGLRYGYAVEQGNGSEIPDKHIPLNDLGAEGWELVSVISISSFASGHGGRVMSSREVAYFKRLVTSL